GQIQVDRDGLDERHPSVAMDANGNFVVAYEKGIATDTGNLPQRAIVAQRYDKVGTKMGGLITVTPADNGFPNAHFGRDPDVAMDAAGDFVVSFTKLFGSPFGIGDNTQTDVFARRYDSSGSFRQEINVSNRSAFTDTAGNSSVAMSPDGRFDIAY